MERSSYLVGHAVNAVTFSRITSAIGKGILEAPNNLILKRQAEAAF
jgi:hypothetical protein